MDDLYFNLSEKEFSRGRKIILWIFGTIFILVGLWDLFLKLFKHNNMASMGVTITAISIGLFVYLIAILASSRKQENYFKVDSNTISYRFGLVAPTMNEITWTEVKTIYMPSHHKNIFIGKNTGRIIKVNLTWIEKNKSRLIKRHIYYVAKQRNIEILKTDPPKK
ncbi:MAG: hypothetical protein R2744_01345 [Bacteroidales bacterium]